MKDAEPKKIEGNECRKATTLAAACHAGWTAAAAMRTL